MTTKIIKPVVITDAEFVSATAYETAPAAYAGGTTYALGADASVAGAAGLITVYRSLQASNTGHAPASNPLWWAPLCITYQVYSGAATYAQFERVISTSAHRIYESLVDSNTGNLLTDATKWNDVGPTNQRAGFDRSVGTATVARGPSRFVLWPGQIGGVVLLELDGATSVDLSLKDATGGTIVYTNPINLDLAEIYDAWDYCFAPFNLRTDLQVTDLPPYPSGELTITINGPADVACGVIVVGEVITVGSPQYGAEVGILDFSRKETDRFGVTDLVERGFARRMDLSVITEPQDLARLYRFLASIRATPCVFIGVDEDGFDPLLVYGFFRDFRIAISYPSYHLCSLQVEGLI